MRPRVRIRFAAIVLAIGVVLISSTLGPLGAHPASAQVPPTPTPSPEEVLRQLLSGLAGGAATGGQPAPGQSAPAQPAQPAPAPPASAVPSSQPGQGRILLQDSLAINSNGRWPENESSYFQGGKYHLISPNLGFVRRVSPAGGAQYDNFSLEITVQLVEGREDGAFGPIFRLIPGSSDYYTFELFGAGYFRLARHMSDPNQWINLTEAARSPAINAGRGAINRLKVVADGSRLELYANDVFLEAVDDAALSYGQIGLLTSSEVHAAYSDLIVRGLPR
jgi:hypothetical protein